MKRRDIFKLGLAVLALPLVKLPEPERIKFLPGEWEYVPLAPLPRDMEFLRTQEINLGALMIMPAAFRALRDSDGIPLVREPLAPGQVWSDELPRLR